MHFIRGDDESNGEKEDDDDADSEEDVMPHLAVSTEGATTPLFVAAQEGREEIVKMLLGCKHVDIEKTSTEGVTPARVASEFGHEYIYGLLSDCISASTKCESLSASTKCESYLTILRSEF